MIHGHFRKQIAIYFNYSLRIDYCDYWSGNMDPYVIITCRTQEHKSSVASGWEFTFFFSYFFFEFNHMWRKSNNWRRFQPIIEFRSCIVLRASHHFDIWVLQERGVIQNGTRLLFLEFPTKFRNCWSRYSTVMAFPVMILLERQSE